MKKYGDISGFYGISDKNSIFISAKYVYFTKINNYIFVIHLNF
jgi:hypothetical protein